MVEMKRFKRDMQKYYSYALFQAKSELKSEVASSYLNWMWWIFDPLFHMLIYTFVSGIVFRTTELYFPVFVFIGQTIWSFFNKMIVQSVGIVRNNKAIVSKAYVPKYILVLSKMFVNGFKMCISFLLVFLLMLISGVPLTPKIFFAIPITMNIVLVTFGLSTIIAHLGVFVEDLKHITEIFLQFLFYFTGIFYAIEKRIPQPFGKIMLTANPVAYHIYALRNVCLYDSSVNWFWMFLWTGFGIVFGFVGIRNVYKYENTYAKII